MRRYYYVYIVRFLVDPNRYYTGLTQDLRRRLMEHNSGNVNHTAKFKPWKIKSAIAFEDPDRARAFEKFLRSGSGRTFAHERF